MSKDNGGPAFPQSEDWQKDMEAYVERPEKFGSPSLQGNGMTLRDYFAAKAMASMVNSLNYVDGGWAQDDIAAQSYQMADAMLLERAK